MALCLVKNMKPDVRFDLLYHNIACTYKGYDKLFCFKCSAVNIVSTLTLKCL